MHNWLQQGIRAFVITAALTAQTAAYGSYSDIVVFGDSLSDSGNAFLATGAPSAPYYNGQYSNGPIWEVTFAQHFGLSSTPALAGGGNYAIAGAATGDTGTGRASPSLLTQQAGYLATHSNHATADALYVIFGGGNDLADALTTANPALVSQGVANVTQMVGDLYDAGARNILVVNSVDIGLTPRVAAFGSAAQTNASLLSVAWNNALSASLASYKSAAGLDLDIFDLFSLQHNVMANAADYGISNTTSACFNSVTVCAQPNSYMYWDDFHPTAAVHNLIAQGAIDALAPVPEPRLALLFLVGLGILGMRYLCIERRCSNN